MFQELLNQCIESISTVRSIIKTNDELRKILFRDHSELSQLKENAPNVTNWRIYDHCAVVTRLYAIYENFVEGLITDWILLLPNLFPNYSNLPDKIRNTHQIGVAELLLELRKEKTRFNHLSVEEVIRGLYSNQESDVRKYDGELLQRKHGRTK